MNIISHTIFQNHINIKLEKTTPKVRHVSFMQKPTYRIAPWNISQSFRINGHVQTAKNAIDQMKPFIADLLTVHQKCKDISKKQHYTEEEKVLTDALLFRFLQVVTSFSDIISKNIRPIIKSKKEETLMGRELKTLSLNRVNKMMTVRNEIAHTLLPEREYNTHLKKVLDFTPQLIKLIEDTEKTLRNNISFNRDFS